MPNRSRLLPLPSSSIPLPRWAPDPQRALVLLSSNVNCHPGGSGRSRPHAARANGRADQCRSAMTPRTRNSLSTRPKPKPSGRSSSANSKQHSGRLKPLDDLGHPYRDACGDMLAIEWWPDQMMAHAVAIKCCGVRGSTQAGLRSVDQSTCYSSRARRHAPGLKPTMRVKTLVR